MRKKSILVSWTGGLDSTYLVRKLLIEGHYVTTSYNKIICNINQSIREKEAIDNLLPLFKEYDNYLGHKETESIGGFTGNVRLAQIPSILQGLIMSYYENDEVAIGYVMNDDSVSFISDITKMWNSYKNICHDKFPKITFPIIKTNKRQIYNELPKRYTKLVTWCERNDEIKTKCGKCSSCKRMKSL